MIRFRCCEHCKDDSVHDVPLDGHEVPCNAPDSRGCEGRNRVTAEPAATYGGD